MRVLNIPTVLCPDCLTSYTISIDEANKEVVFVHANLDLIISPPHFIINKVKSKEEFRNCSLRKNIFRLNLATFLFEY